MILVRDVFHLHFGKAREALELAREGARIETSAGYRVRRILTDLTGQYYTLVMESEFESLGQYEEGLRQGLSSGEWKQWYARFTPLVREGRREIYRIVE
jgi:hypothetical protein